MAYQKIKGVMSDGKTSRYVQVDGRGRLVIIPKRFPVHTFTTGAVAAIATLDPRAAFHLSEVWIHLGSALAAAETLTITLNANRGSVYNVVLFSQDLGTASIVDIIVEFDSDKYDFEKGDKIVIALSANTGADIWGCRTTHELV